jgi:hypothetical protein
LRPIRLLVNEALGRLSGLFNTIYAGSGRALIAPEKLLRAMLIQVFFSVRSERQLMEQVRYNLLYRWFIGLAIDDEVWDHSTFSKNRDRLIEHAVVEGFFTEVMTLADKRALLSKEHWGKTIGHIRQTVYRGLKRVDQHFKLTMTASNIVRIARILGGLPHVATQ